MGWYVVTEFVGIVGQPTVVRLVPRLRPARTSVLALLFLVRGRRLGRSPRRFIRPLKVQHQINQLVLAQMLQISPIHRRIDSEIATRGKGVARQSRFSSSLPRRKRGWVITSPLFRGKTWPRWPIPSSA